MIKNKKKLLFIFIFCGIIYPMGLFNWGALPKAQDNAQTIDEAITAAIVAHEEDPTAHLGDGESLQQHKNNEVIDHPQGSVLGDKFSNKEFTLTFLFENLDKYTKSVSGYGNYVGGFYLDTGATINTVRYLRASSMQIASYFEYNKDVVFQFVVSFPFNGNKLAYIMAGGNGIQGEPPGVGFKFVDQSIYICESVWGEESFDEYTTLISGISSQQNHVYRVQLVASENTAYFYIDSVLVGSLVLHESFDVGLCIFSTYLKNTTASQEQLSMSGVFYSKNPL